jgi:predicted DNA-binding protein
MKREYATGKDVTVRAMVTPETKETVRRMAAKKGMTESEYLRYLIIREIEKSDDPN